MARRRKKLGGNKATNYEEGWIEFADKKIAKLVARALNGTKVDGKKRGFYAEDVWNLKYLKHFTWSHLTEKKAYERRVREHKLRLEMITAKKQNQEFMDLVDKTKMINSIAERKQRKRERKGEEGRGVSGGGGGVPGEKRQKATMGASAGDNAVAGGGGKGKAKAGKADKQDKQPRGGLEGARRQFYQHKPIVPASSSAAASSLF